MFMISFYDIFSLILGFIFYPVTHCNSILKKLILIINYISMKLFFIYILLISFSYSSLNKPAIGENLRYIHILFEWDQEPDAISYNLQASTVSSFNNLILNIEQGITSYIDTENFVWDNDYYWRVRPIYNDEIYGPWIEDSYFYTEDIQLPNLDLDPFDEDEVYDGVMMYSQFSPFFGVGAVDKSGNEIWNTSTAYMNYISPYGELYGLNDGSGVKFNFDHEILWETNEGVSIDSHEIKQLVNGNYMAFVPTYQLGPIPIGPWTDMAQDFGYTADGITNEFYWMGLRIVEFDEDSGEEVWSWDPFTHFTMDDYDQYEGTWWQAIFEGGFDWMHTNAFHFDEQESVIYVSHRHLSRISKIAYPSGEIIWNMGLPAEYGTGLDNICTDLRFSFQHHIQLMDDGTLLFFDNGNISDVVAGDNNPITRLRRVRVIEDSYCETVWQYDLPANLHGLGMGSVQLLDNGNYFIYTYGSGLNNPECSILEITSNGEMIWKATSENPNAAWYRSYKIPSIHPDAFSVIAEKYTRDDNENNIIQISDSSLDFNIYNTSGYDQPYSYEFSNLTNDEALMFNDQSGTITLSPSDNINISFLVENSNIESADVTLSIWPTHHEYAMKELNFSIISGLDLGDINGDNTINVLDVVLLVNIILDSTDFSNSADLNSDSMINVLDVVLLVNIILET